MKRRNFFKKLGIGAGALIVAPKILASEPENNSLFDREALEKQIVKVNEMTEIPRNVMTRAIIKDNRYFKFDKPIDLRANDTILVSNGALSVIYIVVKVNGSVVEAIRNDPRFGFHGKVSVMHLGREFSKG